MAERIRGISCLWWYDARRDRIPFVGFTSHIICTIGYSYLVFKQLYIVFVLKVECNPQSTIVDKIVINTCFSFVEVISSHNMLCCNSMSTRGLKTLIEVADLIEIIYDMILWELTKTFYWKDVCCWGKGKGFKTSLKFRLWHSWCDNYGQTTTWLSRRKLIRYMRKVHL